MVEKEVWQLLLPNYFCSKLTQLLTEHSKCRAGIFIVINVSNLSGGQKIYSRIKNPYPRVAANCFRGSTNQLYSSLLVVAVVTGSYQADQLKFYTCNLQVS